MASKGQVRLNEFWAALDECLPGYTARMSDHYWYIRSPDKQIPECTLPLGKHGTRGNAEIQVGWIKKVARFLRVSDCVAKHIPALRQ